MRDRGLGVTVGRSVMAVWLLLGSSGAVAGPSGAIFTTNADGSFVNANVYEQGDEVYLNGGPRPNAPCSAAGLPKGTYYFQVTDPSGNELLSGFGPENGTLTVEGGLIVDYEGSHATSTGKCVGSVPSNISVQLCPFMPTPNEGEEYKVWVTAVADYRLAGGTFGFFRSASKTDNFKVTTNPSACGGD